MNSHPNFQSRRTTNIRNPLMALGIITLIAAFAISTFAESWENKDWTQWTSQDCYHILAASPWTAQLCEDCNGTALIVSGIAVRQALERQAQFDQHYDKMTPEQKKTFDQKAARCIGKDLSDRIIVRLTPVNSWPDATSFGPWYSLYVDGREVPYALLPQGNTISPCLGGSPVIGMLYLDIAFKRIVNGKPVIQPGDKKIVVGTSAKDGFEFNIEKMTYKGKPDY